MSDNRFLNYPIVQRPTMLAADTKFAAIDDRVHQTFGLQNLVGRSIETAIQPYNRLLNTDQETELKFSDIPRTRTMQIDTQDVQNTRLSVYQYTVVNDPRLSSVNTRK